MDASQALKLLLPIPAEQFIKNTFSRPELRCCCTAGHLYRLTSSNPIDYSFMNCAYNEEVGAFNTQVSNFLHKIHNIMSVGIPDVNDNDHVNGYTEKEIKDRAIHLFKDMVEAGY